VTINENILYNSVYRKLKQAVYYNSDLFLKRKLALYECGNADKDNLQIIFQYMESQKPIPENIKQIISDWINQISYYVLPKSVSPYCNIKEKGKAEEIENDELSNVISADTYYWHGINYYIDLPLPLHMLDVLWIMKVGVYLDEKLGDCCFGNRVHENLCEKKSKDAGSHLMKIYGKQYAMWQNKALDLANKAIDNKEIVDILTLDFKQFYYYVEGDFREIKEYITEKSKELTFTGDIQPALFLTDILERIHKKFNTIIQEYTSVTHKPITKTEIKYFLPIGLFSSGILANWHLKEFDKRVIDIIAPRYYGRYVDDCIFVFARAQYNEEDKGHHRDHLSKKALLQKYFVDTKILTAPKKGDIQTTLSGEPANNPGISDEEDYILIDPRFKEPRITVQNSKVMFYHVDPNYSTAILSLFKKKIKENASVFQYLPEESIIDTLDTGMHQLVFSDGSTNKLRNLKKLVVDDSKLAVTLSKQISHISLCSKPIPKIGELTKNMFKDLRGNNYLTYIRVWEKMFSILVFSRKQEQDEELLGMIGELLEHITHLEPSKDYYTDEHNVEIRANGKEILSKLSSKIHSVLIDYLQYSVSQPLALLDRKSRSTFANKLSTVLEKYLSLENSNPSEISLIESITDSFRAANLFPQHYVIYPLLNYLNDYDGDLVDVDVFNTNSIESLELDSQKLNTTPRFIHLFEYQLFFALKKIRCDQRLTDCSKSDCSTPDDPFCCYLQKADNEFGQRAYSNWGATYNSHVTVAPFPRIKYYDTKPVCPTKITINSDEKTHEKIRVGIVNLLVSTNDLKHSYEPLEMSPNISLERWLKISQALNAAVKEKCDLVILPECSIPHRWLSTLTHWSKQHQIGLIFGLEYVYNSKTPDTISFDKKSDKECIAFNMTAALLPFQINELYKSCCVSLRIKNHYAPQEKEELKKFGYSLPDLKSSTYHLYNWRDTQFTIYNCFELADIQHRGIFRCELDYLIACSVNQDVPYFMDILDSVVRDLHCYVIYSNTSEYGCSRIIQPTKQDMKNIAQIGGGANSTLLVGELDIDALRKFHSHEYDGKESPFKPLPPGFNHKNVTDCSNK
jgi:hypothetical protein